MKKILVTPLDWGLGHATRCIPIIRYLLEKDCHVIIGADGRPLQLLKKEFPLLDFIVIPGYNISYPETVSMTLKIAGQIPKFLSGIKREHELLRKIVREQKPDAIISDNRFGLWSSNVPCVFITHQLIVKSCFGEKLIHTLNKNYISKFSECWVPDYISEESNLSGDLSHKFPLPGNAKFIGILSRFSPPADLPASRIRFVLQEREEKELLVILSGPEPQRTIFEKKLMEQLTSLKIKTLIVQGMTEKNERKKLSTTVKIVSHLASEELQKEILASQLVLSRPGYSSIMDLAILRKKAVFVPTPGQTEQEYLAETLTRKKIAYSVSQKKFDVISALKESENYSGFTKNYSGEEFKEAIDKFISH